MSILETVKEIFSGADPDAAPAPTPEAAALKIIDAKLAGLDAEIGSVSAQVERRQAALASVEGELERTARLASSQGGTHQHEFANLKARQADLLMLGECDQRSLRQLEAERAEIEKQRTMRSHNRAA